MPYMYDVNMLYTAYDVVNWCYALPLNRFIASFVSSKIGSSA